MRLLIPAGLANPKRSGMSRVPQVDASTWSDIVSWHAPCAQGGCVNHTRSLQHEPRLKCPTHNRRHACVMPPSCFNQQPPTKSYATLASCNFPRWRWVRPPAGSRASWRGPGRRHRMQQAAGARLLPGFASRFSISEALHGHSFGLTVGVRRSVSCKTMVRLSRPASLLDQK